MTGLDRWTPVNFCGDSKSWWNTFEEIPESYFSFLSNHKALIVPGTQIYSFKATSRGNIVTFFKVLSCFTIVLPVLMLMGKVWFRYTHDFSKMENLADKWKFLSDHVPVGIKVDGIRIVSWNVLNSFHMHWVLEDNSQGLNGSVITQLHAQDLTPQEHKKEGKTLPSLCFTERDKLVLEKVRKMAKVSDVICLQECGHLFLNELSAKLPRHWKLLRKRSSESLARYDDEAVLFNKKVHLEESSELSQPCDFDTQEKTQQIQPVEDLKEESLSPKNKRALPNRLLQSVHFTYTSKSLSKKQANLFILNSHLNGMGESKEKFQFAWRVLQIHSAMKRKEDPYTVVGLGDQNYDRMEEIYAKALPSLEKKQKQQGQLQGGRLYTTSLSNIDPATRQAKGIDPIYVTGSPSLSAQSIPSQELLSKDQGLKDTLALLNSLGPSKAHSTEKNPN